MVGMVVKSIFLDDTWIQRVEVHNENELVVQTLLRVKHETPWGVNLFCRCGPLSPESIRAYIFQPVELMKKNVLVTLRTAAIQGLVPVIFNAESGTV